MTHLLKAEKDHYVRYCDGSAQEPDAENLLETDTATFGNFCIECLSKACGGIGRLELPPPSTYVPEAWQARNLPEKKNPMGCWLGMALAITFLAAQAYFAWRWM